MHKQYQSAYCEHIKAYIELKRKLGFKFKIGAFILSQLDRHADKARETTAGISKSFAETWSNKRLNESDRYRYARVRMLAQFSLYLRDIGIESFVPKQLPYPTSTFIPYIYSQKEIKAIFKASEELKLSRRCMRSSLFSMPAMIRILYGTGIRIGEALALREDDINVIEGFVRVRDSKNGKERLLPISDTLVNVCKEYLKYKKQLPIGRRRSAYFFVNLNGEKCDYLSISHWFKKCQAKASIRCIDRNHYPRIHDLRHTFAVTSLANMAESGIDLYASLPILSSYLGHQSLGATNHYVRLTANMYPSLIKDVDMVCLDVFPKIKNYETN